MGYNTDTLDDLAYEVHTIARSHGFWLESHQVSAETVMMKLALVHSEVTEVLEAVRKSQGPNAICDEFADIIIRVCDLYGAMRESWNLPSLHSAVREKCEKNKHRPYLHGHKVG